jgi:hypothetical protein
VVEGLGAGALLAITAVMKMLPRVLVPSLFLLVACGDDSTGTGGADGSGGGATSASTTTGSATTSSSSGEGGEAATTASSTGSGEGGSGEGGSGEGGSAEVCDDSDPACALCLASAACDPENEDPADCPDEDGTYLACFIRAEAVEPFLECIADCDVNDDVCAEQVGAALEPTENQDAYDEACTQALEDCPGDFSNDYCTQGDFYHLILNDGIYETLAPCFDLECDEIEACLGDTYGPEFEACIVGG